MAVLLDTTAMTSEQRRETMEMFLDSQAIPMRFSFDRPAEHMETWASAVRLGGLQVLGAGGCGMLGTRGKREVAGTFSELVNVASFTRGDITGIRGGDEDYLVRPGELLVLDQTEPCVMSWPDGFGAIGIQIRHSELGLPADVIRRGVRNLPASPMFQLVSDHIARLAAALTTMAESPQAQLLGDVTRDLVRALIATAGQPPSVAAEALHEALPLRIERYILQHIGDPALSARQIAAEHYISVRQLYYLWSRRDRSLGEWIIAERLAGASRELAAPRSARTIASVASRWGFADPTHFARRFRERYGMSPREYREFHRAGKGLGATDAAV